MSKLGIASTALVLCVTLAGCGPRVITKTEIKTVEVPVRVSCPDDSTYAEIMAQRPVPLRQQEMPTTAEQRVAVSQAQLGRYEAEGAWADQASAVIHRCHAQGVAPTK